MDAPRDRLGITFVPAGVAKDVRAVTTVATMEAAREAIARDLVEHLVFEDASPLMEGTLVSIPSGRYVVELEAARPEKMYAKARAYTRKAPDTVAAPVTVDDIDELTDRALERDGVTQLVGAGEDDD